MEFLNMEFLNNTEIQKFQEIDFQFLNRTNKEDINPPIKTKRGRAREKQLQKMSKIEREQENLRMKEKNRLVAKKYRRNKKIYIENLKTKVIEYEDKINKQNTEIELLNFKILQYRRFIENDL